MGDKEHRPAEGSGWIDSLIRTEQLPDDYRQAVTEHVAPLAESIGELHRSLLRPVIVGVNGAQGAGKSTLSLFLSHWLERELDLRVASLSLDDFYLTKAERRALAQAVHPLFATRGVPGTHDVALATRVLDALTDVDGPHRVAVPSFDKAADDREREASWQVIAAPVDVVLFEGWCIGARPQRAVDLQEPVNALEAVEDTAGTWRRSVNERLSSEYAALFARLDLLVMLRVPSFEKVFEWRGLQERKLREASGRGQTDEELLRFVRHFERLTRHMLKRMPDYADVVLDIDDEHHIDSTLSSANC